MGIVSSRQRKYLVDLTNDQASAPDIQTGYCQADPITTQGKRMQLGQITLAFLVPVVYLAITAVIEISNRTAPYHDHVFLHKQLENILEAKASLDTIESNCFRINSVSINNADRYSDFDIDQFESIWPIQTMLTEDEIEDENERIRELGTEAGNGVSNITDCELYQELTTFVNQILLSVSRHAHDNVVQLDLFLLRMLIQIRRSYAVQMVIGSNFLDTGDLPHNRYSMFIKQQGVIEEGVLFCKLQSKLFKDTHAKLYRENRKILESYAVVQQWIFGRSYPIQVEYNYTTKWQDSVVAFMDISSQTWRTIADDLTGKVNNMKNSIDRFKTLVRVGLSLALILFLVMMTVIYLVTKQCQQYVVEATEQTKQLRREKKTSDSLLYQMLPKSVALQLKMNRRVAGETYNSVSIYFSDIVGFTKLCSKSTPMQVVALLNKLYFLFDSTIEKYDVYKMETIGDAYMVTSGVPQRNGKRHAGELASFSLELLEGVRVFSVPHMPNECVRMRVGLHTGTVVAGIVGTRMPRYCLFGETVVIASAMESQGIPMRVQISSACRDALLGAAVYSTEKRGTLTIKGVDVETHFLLGKVSSRTGSLADPEVTLLDRSQRF